MIKYFVYIFIILAEQSWKKHTKYQQPWASSIWAYLASLKWMSPANFSRLALVWFVNCSFEHNYAYYAGTLATGCIWRVLPDLQANANSQNPACSSINFAIFFSSIYIALTLYDFIRALSYCWTDSIFFRKEQTEAFASIRYVRYYCNLLVNIDVLPPASLQSWWLRKTRGSQNGLQHIGL